MASYMTITVIGLMVWLEHGIWLIQMDSLISDKQEWYLECNDAIDERNDVRDVVWRVWVWMKRKRRQKREERVLVLKVKDGHQASFLPNIHP